MSQRKPRTWRDVYEHHRRQGDDPFYAIFAADEWEERKRREAVKTGKSAGPWHVWQMQCAYCAHKWVAVVYEGTPEVQCPGPICGLMNVLVSAADESNTD